jgi:hypothetical protein
MTVFIGETLGNIRCNGLAFQLGLHHVRIRSDTDIFHTRARAIPDRLKGVSKWHDHIRVVVVLTCCFNVFDMILPVAAVKFKKRVSFSGRGKEPRCADHVDVDGELVGFDLLAHRGNGRTRPFPDIVKLKVVAKTIALDEGLT